MSHSTALLQEPSPYELGLLLGVDLNLSSPPKVRQQCLLHQSMVRSSVGYADECRCAGVGELPV